MRRHELSDAQWVRLEPLLTGRAGSPGARVQDNRRFINAVVWIAKTGAPWCDLPECFGPWRTAYQRFRRWATSGRWQTIFEAMQDPDLEWIMLDSTSIRAQSSASGQKGAASSTDLDASLRGPSVAEAG